MALQVGDNFNPPVTDISAIYLNLDRICQDKLKVLGESGLPQGGDMLFDSIGSFDLAHPDFLIPDTRTGLITVFCFQTPFMQARLSEILRVDNQVYGLVSDEAHKMFHNQGKLLMTTSTYLPVIKQWLPVLYSFMNGLTSEHYCHHFLVLFQTLTRQRHEDGLQVTDEDFTMVCGMVRTA